MIKKIIILALVIWLGVIFYRKFVASTMEPFFKRNTGSVDFIQKKVPEHKVNQ